MIRKAFDIVQARGIPGLLRAAHSRLRGVLARRSKSILTYKNQFIDRSGIEIGGPSQVFSGKGIFPVYPIVRNLDNCNFCGTTVWESSVNAGKTFLFDPGKPAGQQYIAEATLLPELPSDSYDFVLSSHMLEHSANPIQALSEWKRLLRTGGILVLVLPDKNHTFDHRRPTTALGHLIEDFNVGMAEDDLSHLPEILALHDLTLDPEAGDVTTFRRRSMRNFENRCLHHHVFDTELAVALVEHVGLKVIATEEIRPHHILLLAEKRQQQS